MPLAELGAKGDGIADDTDALQRALYAGGEVRVARGTYRITRPLDVELADHGPISIRGEGGARLVMAGPGPALRVLGSHAGSADPASVKPGVWERERMPVVDGLEIVGAHPGADGLELSGTLQATLTRLLIRDVRHAVHVIKRNRNIIIADCHLFHNSGVGVFLDGVNLHQINIHGSHISYNGVGGIVVRRSEIRNLQIVGNDIEYNYGAPNTASADVWIEADEQSVREVTISGNTIQAKRSPGGANVRIVGQSAAAPHKVGLISITGNQISSQEINVHLKWSRGVVIDGNTFQIAYKHAILAEDSSALVIGANTFERNPDYPPEYVDGIVIDRCQGAQLAGFGMDGCRAGAPEEGGAVEIRGSEDVSVRDVQILRAAHRGMELRDSRHCTVRGCHIRGMRQAMRVVGGGANWIAGNYLEGGGADSLRVEPGSGIAEQNHLL